MRSSVRPGQLGLALSVMKVILIVLFVVYLEKQYMMLIYNYTKTELKLALMITVSF